VTVAPLFYLTDVAFGGFVSYTAHLALALERTGHCPMLYRLAKRDARGDKPWSHGVRAFSTSLDTMLRDLKAAGQGLITCSYWRTHAEATEALLRAGADIILHDPTEMTPPLMECIERHRRRVVVIRPTNVENVRRRGVSRVTFVPHPYVRRAVSSQHPRSERAVTLSRVDFDKGTHLVVPAFDALPPGDRGRCHIYGAVNRLYAFHKLEKACPGWEARYYRGRFPKTADAPLLIAGQAEYVVDMSTIRDDGGGTQYTFFEAWDAGAALVVHDGWLRPGGELAPGVNCLSVGSSEALARLLSSPPSASDTAVLADGAGRTLAAHSPAVVAPLLVQALGWQ
jgi:hypothetical protein